MTRFQSRFGEVVLIADGMGGHQGGATASEMAAKRFGYYLDLMAESVSLPEALQKAAERVNDEIYERGHAGDAAVAGMGSTLVVAVLRQTGAGQEAVVANAGDSRAYLVRGGALRLLTNDHTAAQRMVDAGVLTPEEARNHPNASVLTRALGLQRGTTAETYPPVALEPGDGLLLCSDGLSGFAMDADIARAVAGSGDPNGVVRNLIDLALKAGSDDNITVQFLRIGEKSAGAAFGPITGSGALATPRGPRWLYVAAGIIILVALASAAGWLTWKRMHPIAVNKQHDAHGATSGGPAAGDDRKPGNRGHAKSPQANNDKPAADGGTQTVPKPRTPARDTGAPPPNGASPEGSESGRRPPKHAVPPNRDEI